MPAQPDPHVFTNIAGVTPCPSGWLVIPGRLAGVTLTAEAPFVLTRLREVLDYRPSFAITAVNAAIGYPARPIQPYRDCDLLARALLGWPRCASIAPTPSRDALFASSFEKARVLEPWLRPSDERRFARLRELASEIQPFHARSVVAGLAELAFFQMNREVALATSGWRDIGRSERLALISSVMPGVDTVVERPPPPGVEPKLVVDAAAMLWVARRAWAHTIVRLPADPEWSDRGIRMEWVM